MGFCRAWLVGLKQAMRGFKTKSIFSAGEQQDSGADGRRSEARGVGHEGDCRGDYGFLASYLCLGTGKLSVGTLEMHVGVTNY
ncbi:unnamed protein product [Periconia digitata]|uniref:Uncharacterized protein n=1 Tax=Periconia digitata TaxID=1303443 RepID=A0A9W4XJ32_9PLEO|nr:unnamed protein product [Periconia digitata]